MGLDKAENDSGEQAIFVFDEDEDNFVGRVRQDLSLIHIFQEQKNTASKPYSIWYCFILI